MEKKRIAQKAAQNCATRGMRKQNEDDGIRTRNHRIDSPSISRSNINSHKQITTSNSAYCSAGRSDMQREGGILDADLARLVCRHGRRCRNRSVPQSGGAGWHRRAFERKHTIAGTAECLGGVQIDRCGCGTLAELV